MEINLTPDSSYPDDLTEVLIDLYHRAQAELSAWSALEPHIDNDSEEAYAVRTAIEARLELTTALAALFVDKRLMPFPPMPISLN